MLKSIRNQKLSKEYEIVRELLEFIKKEARLDVKVPKTLFAFRRERDALERIEREFYLGFLVYGVSVAETLTFASKFGIWRFVDKGDFSFTHEEKRYYWRHIRRVPEEPS